MVVQVWPTLDDTDVTQIYSASVPVAETSYQQRTSRSFVATASEMTINWRGTR